MKRILQGLMILLMGLSLCGCKKLQSETYTSNGLTITMQEGFEEDEVDFADIYFESEKALFTALKENFDSLKSVDLGDQSTIEEYLTKVIANNEIKGDLVEYEDLKLYEYEYTVDDQDYYYFVTAVKTDDAFWLLNFACRTEDKDEYKPLFAKWTKTVSINPED